LLFLSLTVKVSYLEVFWRTSGQIILSANNLAVQSTIQNLFHGCTKACYRETQVNFFWQEFSDTLLLFFVGVVFRFVIKKVRQLACWVHRKRLKKYWNITNICKKLFKVKVHEFGTICFILTYTLICINQSLRQRNSVLWLAGKIFTRLIYDKGVQ